MVKQRSNISQINIGAATQSVLTDQTTTSTTYADLATVGPTVTVTIGSSGQALVSVAAGIYTGSSIKSVGVNITGATTRAPSVGGNTLRKDDAPFTTKSNITYIETGLNPGSTTFTMKYNVSGGTANFFDRILSVVPL